VLFLGGSAAQMPAISYAREAGYYVITADYLPQNPGHALAHEYHNVSTIDKEGILKLAASLEIDGIVAYASEPAAPTAAFVAERLGLPTNPYATVDILTSKDRYRAFLAQQGFACPRHTVCRSLDEARPSAHELTLPVVIKPVDSSGSRGVSVLRDWGELEPAFATALSFSRAKRVILEEFIGRMGEQIIGEGFVWNGELILSCFGKHRFDPGINGLVPIGGDFPFGEEDTRRRLCRELQRLITAVGLQMGPMNLELRLGTNGEVYLMEVTPRNGGNLIPQLVTHATGFDMVKNAVDVALGCACDRPSADETAGFHSYCVLHSTSDGILDKLAFSPRLRAKIIEEKIWIKPGARVAKFTGAPCSIGVLILRFDSAQEMEEIMDAITEHVGVTVT
jgi:biotin carboxylase